MIRTLIVDDHPAIREGLLRIFRSEPGIVPIGAVADSASALNVATSAHPRCVVVDLQLGGEDGLELIQQLRALPDPPGVVLYTAFAEPSIETAAAAAGAGASVGKGAPIDEVIAAVKRVSRRRAVTSSPSSRA
jgi:DNA-binding NarL/FixJ family response regulator